MTRSSRSAPDPSQRAAATIVRDALTHWRGGVFVMVLVAGVLAFRWLHSASHVYESFVVFGPTANAVAAGGQIEAPTDDTRPSLEGSLREALSQLEQLNGSADEPLAPGTASLQKLGKDRVILVCRADSAQDAYERCARATTIAIQRVPSLHIVELAALATRPLPAARDAAPVVLLMSGLFGLIGGWLWMHACVLWSAGRPAVSSARGAATPVRVTSHGSTPPPQQVSSSPEGRAPSGPRVEAERAWVKRVAEARSRPPESIEPSAPRGVESRRVVTVSVGGEWTMDRSLAEPKPDADLQRLCDHIADLPSLCNQFSAVAATECFVLGVTSRPEHRRLKARLAARLSWLFAQNEHARILLLEVDLNHPSIDGVMRIVMPPGAGFSLQLQGQLDKVDRVPPWTVVGCTPQLSVLAEGRLRTPSMAYFPHFPAALASLRPHYDVIVAHGPAIDSAQTASAFEDLVDGIVFAVPPDMSESDAQAAGSQWFKSPVLAVAALRGHSLP